MCNSARAVLFFILIGASVAADPAPNQFVARYESFGESSGTFGSAGLLAVDASGNFFIVGTVTEPFGRPQIRAVKTDPQGNLLVVGTTYLQNFPLVSPFISQSSQQAGFMGSIRWRSCTRATHRAWSRESFK